jgi:hypothetical protein
MGDSIPITWRMHPKSRCGMRTGRVDGMVLKQGEKSSRFLNLMDWVLGGDGRKSWGRGASLF